MAPPFPAPWLLALPAPRPPDALAFLLLALFVVWGALRGPTRQILSLGVLVLAFGVAGRFGSALESTVAKVTGLAPAERAALAWGLAVFCGLVVGAIALRFVAHALPPSRGAAGARWLGGLLGAFKGVFVLVVVGYLVLGGPGDVLGPPLARSDTADGPAGERPGLADRLRGTWTGHGLRESGPLLVDWLKPPAWVRKRVAAVNRDLGEVPLAGAGAARRPTGGD